MKLGAAALCDDGYETFLGQLGVDSVIASYDFHPIYSRGATNPVTGFHPLEFEWSFLDLVRLRHRFEDVGLGLFGLEGPVPQHCHALIGLGLPGRDAQISAICTLLENMGRAGIHNFGYAWMINPPGQRDYSWRTSFTTRGRHGARLGSFSEADAARAPGSFEAVPSTEELWSNYEYFMNRVLPVAEGAGVNLCLHPDDPPLPSLGGVPRLFHDLDGHRRAMDIAGGSPHSKILLCLGNWYAMGVDVCSVIEEFGVNAGIGYVHMQAIRRHDDGFVECFLDEAELDMRLVLSKLAAAGFAGPIQPAHLPRTEFDTWRQDGQTAFALGYVRGLLKSLSLKTDETPAPVHPAG